MENQTMDEWRTIEAEDYDDLLRAYNNQTATLRVLLWISMLLALACIAEFIVFWFIW